MKTFVIRCIPTATDFRGRIYPAHFALKVKCSRGHGWCGGEFPTREAAYLAGKKATARA